MEERWKEETEAALRMVDLTTPATKPTLLCLQDNGRIQQSKTTETTTHKSFKDRAPTYKFSKRKAWLIKFCWPMNICFKSWCQLWPLIRIAGLERLADLTEPLLEPLQNSSLCKQTGKLGRETDQCACIHWTVVIHISGPSCEAHLKQVLMIGKQIFITHAFLLENL